MDGWMRAYQCTRKCDHKLWIGCWSKCFYRKFPNENYNERKNHLHKIRIKSKRWRKQKQKQMVGQCWWNKYLSHLLFVFGHVMLFHLVENVISNFRCLIHLNSIHQKCYTTKHEILSSWALFIFISQKCNAFAECGSVLTEM